MLSNHKVKILCSEGDVYGAKNHWVHLIKWESEYVTLGTGIESKKQTFIKQLIENHPRPLKSYYLFMGGKYFCQFMKFNKNCIIPFGKGKILSFGTKPNA